MNFHDFEEILALHNISPIISKTKDSIVFEFNSAQVIFSNEQILGVVDNLYNCHIWEILPNKKDYEYAIRKIQLIMN